MALMLASSVFSEGADIPRRYTCDGDDCSPPLAWSGVPPAAQSLALIVDDPDAPDPKAPRMIWTHWVLYDLPPDCVALPEAVPAAGLPHGTREGTNDWRRTGYGGPCPPIGRHRYFHRLYALDVKLGDLHRPTREKLLQAMRGHILAEATLLGHYRR